jgi:hypothetical protein
MKEAADWIGDIIFFKTNAWQSVKFHLIKCANRLKDQICKKPTYGIFLATLNDQSLYSLPYEEEEEEDDTFIHQLWAHKTCFWSNLHHAYSESKDWKAK